MFTLFETKILVKFTFAAAVAMEYVLRFVPVN